MQIALMNCSSNNMKSRLKYGIRDVPYAPEILLINIQRRSEVSSSTYNAGCFSLIDVIHLSIVDVYSEDENNSAY